MNTFRVIFFFLAFTAALLVLIQNFQPLGYSSSLVLDLWFFRLTSPEISFYIFVFFCFVLGIVFALITFYPGNRELRKNLKLLQNRVKLLREEYMTVEKEREQELKNRQAELESSEESPGAASEHEHKSGLAGKVAVGGCIILLVALVGLYYHSLQEREQLQEQMADLEKAVQEEITPVKKDVTTTERRLEELDKTLQERTARIRSVQDQLQEESQQIKAMQDKLQEHAGELEVLQRLPQQTRDYLKLIRLQEYLQSIKYLELEAETEEDKERLQEAGQVLEEAIEHFRDKKPD